VSEAVAQNEGYLVKAASYDMLHLDYLRPGTDGFLNRIKMAQPGADIYFHTMQTYDEPLDGDLLIGDPAYVDYVLAAYAKGRKWSELVVEMHNALVHCGDRPPFVGPYLKNRNMYLTGSCLNLRDHQIDLVNLGTDVQDRVSEEDGYRNYHLNGVGYQIYGHWLLDFLPRIFLADRHARSLGCKAHIFLPRPPKFALKLLDILDVGCRFSYFTQQAPLWFDRIYAVPSVKLGLRYSSHFVGETFTRLKSHRTENFPGAERILIARRKPPIAKNFAILEAALKNLDFKVIYPEDYSIEDQISIFKAARVVVGEDGSAMHNVGFCDSGAKVIITARSSRRNVWHVSVTQYAAVRLAYLASAVQDDGYEIDIPAVLRLLESP
jgi:Glycosyltransferase 61